MPATASAPAHQHPGADAPTPGTPRPPVAPQAPKPHPPASAPLRGRRSPRTPDPPTDRPPRQTHLQHWLFLRKISLFPCPRIVGRCTAGLYHIQGRRCTALNVAEIPGFTLRRARPGGSSQDLRDYRLNVLATPDPGRWWCCLSMPACSIRVRGREKVGEVRRSTYFVAGDVLTHRCRRSRPGAGSRGAAGGRPSSAAFHSRSDRSSVPSSRSPGDRASAASSASACPS